MNGPLCCVTGPMASFIICCHNLTGNLMAPYPGWMWRVDVVAACTTLIPCTLTVPWNPRSLWTMAFHELKSPSSSSLCERVNQAYKVEYVRGAHSNVKVIIPSFALPDRLFNCMCMLIYTCWLTRGLQLHACFGVWQTSLPVWRYNKY